ncbi:MAG: type VI secretion system baseplate subunit TssF, partial [Candidatus Margulisbacteria bacterium]|nr:type VI secretion system baseplate subunit TssF [Candidatus Margulisiibacteriota bacterium]
MSSIEKYFKQELRYLEEKGTEFAQEFPETAAHLNIESKGDRDPYIERLFEGFSFLTGRIQQRLDDDFPEISENLLESIAPEFLRPVPSMCMMQFNSRPGMQQNLHSIEKSSKISSNPVGAQHTFCEFQTTKKVEVFPLNLKSVNKVMDNRMGNGLRFTFQFEKAAKLETLTDPCFTLYLDGERSNALFLLEALTCKTQKIKIEVNGVSVSMESMSIPKVIAGGMGAEDQLLPGDTSCLGSAGTLQDYFSFQERYRFIEFKGLDFLKTKKGLIEFSIEVYSDSFASETESKIENVFKLFVSPAINLFAMGAEPIHLDHTKFEYPLRLGKYHVDVYKIEKMEGISKKGGLRKNYRNYSQVSLDYKAPYSFNRKQNHLGQYSGSLSVEVPESLGDSTEEYLSISLSATNGNLPRQELSIGDIINASSEIPGFILATNITRPTATLYPPDAKDYTWYVINHMNVNLMNLCENETFLKMLDLYHWQENTFLKTLKNKFFSISSKSRSFLHQRALYRGTEVTVKWSDEFWNDPGEVALFGRVLLQFLTNFVSLN